MAKLMISVSGVRGVVGEGLTPEVVLNFAHAFGTYVQGGKVVVGRDSRVSGKLFENVALSGLMSIGCDIVNIGVCPTPTTQLAVENLKAAGGLMITASHNPIMWNGLKLIGADGLFLDAEQGQQVLSISQEKNFLFASWDKLGVSEKYSKAIDVHIEAILNLPYVDVEGIRQRKFKVALDCVCGAGANLIPQLLHQLGCEVFKINCEPTGLFPRTPEPLPENLGELCELVKAKDADIGIAVDPDSDRLALVSEGGEPLGEEKTLAIAVKFILSKKSGPVVINASTSQMTEKVAIEAGAAVERTKVGEIYVAKRMREIGAVIGGEGNGGVILPDVHLGRDAPIGIALTLQHLVDCAIPLSEVSQNLPNYKMIKDKIELAEMQPKAALTRIREVYADESLDFTDGIKINRETSWAHIRASNTEPIIRVISEAPGLEEAKAFCSEIKEKLSGV